MLLLMMMMLMSLASLVKNGSCVCYFPVEYQGVFATQSISTPANLHKYSTITILPDAVPVWGVCHHKDGKNVVLFDATGGRQCYRCFHLMLRSPNVIQVHTEGVDRCHRSVDEARASCPSLGDITSKRAREIMLYKSRSFTREGTIARVFCPINGQFSFKYNVNDGTEAQHECPQATSTLDNCPRGSEMHIRFQRCTFGDLKLDFRCLGNWKGYDGRQYLALWDSTTITDGHPRYRCAMYETNATSGVVNLTFSVDATCTNQLVSPTSGYETLVLTPKAVVKPPTEVKTHACTFPDWARGKWQHLEIFRHDVRLQDSAADKVYDMECNSQHAPHGERYALFSRDQCGHEEFTCIWIKKRAVNVIEFQMSKYPSDHYNRTQICADDMFLGQHWKTEGRIGKHEEPSCPIQGEHHGVLPDASELCAKLTSDCSSPQKMHYTVSACANKSEVYEEREYRCLGRWAEGGVTYTYTHRVDVNTYECFAGVVVNSKEIFIIEAGVNCQRGMQPLAYGMKLVQKATCDDLRARTIATSTLPPPPTTTNYTTPWFRNAPRFPHGKKGSATTRRPFWKTDHNLRINGSSSHFKSSSYATLWLSVLLLLWSRTLL